MIQGLYPLSWSKNDQGGRQLSQVAWSFWVKLQSSNVCRLMLVVPQLDIRLDIMPRLNQQIWGPSSCASRLPSLHSSTAFKLALQLYVSSSITESLSQSAPKTSQYIIYVYVCISRYIRAARDASSHSGQHSGRHAGCLPWKPRCRQRGSRCSASEDKRTYPPWHCAATPDFERFCTPATILYLQMRGLEGIWTDLQTRSGLREGAGSLYTKSLQILADFPEFIALEYVCRQPSNPQRTCGKATDWFMYAESA